MPTSISSKRRLRKTKRETARNKPKRSQVHNMRKEFMESLDSGNKQAAEESFREYCSALDKAAKHNVIHQNTAQRRKSRAKSKVDALS